MGISNVKGERPARLLTVTEVYEAVCKNIEEAKAIFAADPSEENEWELSDLMYTKMLIERDAYQMKGNLTRLE